MVEGGVGKGIKFSMFAANGVIFVSIFVLHFTSFWMLIYLLIRLAAWLSLPLACGHWSIGRLWSVCWAVICTSPLPQSSLPPASLSPLSHFSAPWVPTKVMIILFCQNWFLTFYKQSNCFFLFVSEIRFMLLVFFVLLFLIFILMLVGGILGYVFRNQVCSVKEFVDSSSSSFLPHSFLTCKLYCNL